MNIKTAFLLVSVSIVALTGCNLTTSEEATISADQVLTAIVQTVDAALSLTPPATSTSTPTATETATATATFTPSATASPTVQTGSVYTQGQASGCDNAAFAGDVTIPDGTQFAPETAFTKTWRMSNTGSCAWTTGYSVVFVNGDGMGGVSPQSLTSETAPGSSREISVNLVAPKNPGTYTGYWQLRNPAGNVFGHQFYVQIVVTGGTTPTATATGPTGTPTVTNTPGGSGKPDLKITSITFDPPSPTRNGSFKVQVKVENVGDADAGAFMVEWWSDQGNEDPKTKTTWNVSSLAANSSKTLEYYCDKSAGACTAYDSSGNYTSKAFADANNAIQESDEDNNQKTQAVTISQ